MHKIVRIDKLYMEYRGEKGGVCNNAWKRTKRLRKFVQSAIRKGVAYLFRVSYNYPIETNPIKTGSKIYTKGKKSYEKSVFNRFR